MLTTADSAMIIEKADQAQDSIDAYTKAEADARFTLIGANFIAIIGIGADVVDRLDPFVKGIVAQNREVTCGLFCLRFPLVESFRNLATQEQSQRQALVDMLCRSSVDINHLTHVHVISRSIVRNGVC